MKIETLTCSDPDLSVLNRVQGYSVYKIVSGWTLENSVTTFSKRNHNKNEDEFNNRY